LCVSRSGNYYPDAKEHLFNDSTHAFLFMEMIKLENGITFKVTWVHIVSALCTILWQYFFYAGLAYLMTDEGEVWKNGVLTAAPVEISTDFCFNKTIYGDHEISYYYAERFGQTYSNLKEANVTAEHLLELLQCGVSSPQATGHVEMSAMITLQSMIYAICGILFLWVFLLPDLFDSYVIFWQSGYKTKFAAFLVLLEAVIATFVGWMALRLAGPLGFLDGIFLCIGIVTIHQMDEQFRRVVDTFHAVRRRRLGFFKLQVFLFLLLLFIVCFFLFGFQIRGYGLMLSYKVYSNDVFYN